MKKNEVETKRKQAKKYYDKEITQMPFEVIRT